MNADDTDVLLSVAPSSSKFLGIVLGASSWPYMPAVKPSTAFARVAERFRDYLLSEAGLNLSPSSVLNLFDRDLSYIDIDDRIRKFLQSHYEENRPNFTDVLVLYTGHGDFTAGDQQYQLILRSTRQEQKDMTGYQMRHLARTMNELARNIRKIVFLDCCYAAAAFAAWQMQSTNIAEAIRQQAENQFPASGTALLCACNEDQWALYKEQEDALTMFGAGLLQALENGTHEAGEFLSITDVYKIICREIRGQHLHEGVEPVLHVPKGRRGDLIATPMFPNPAIRMSKSDIRLSRIESTLADIKESLVAIESNFEKLHRVCERRPENENFFTRVGILYGGTQNISSGVLTYNLAKLKRLGGYAPVATRVLHINKYDPELRAYWVSSWTQYEIRNLFRDSEYEDLVTISVAPDTLNKDVEIGRIKSVNTGGKENINSYCVIPKEGCKLSFPICIKEGSSIKYTIHIEMWYACNEEQSMFPRRYVESISMKVINQCIGAAPSIMDLSDSKVTTLGYNNEYHFKEINDVKDGDTIFKFKLLELK